MEELRIIMDEFTEIGCNIEELKILLKICESYCEDKLDEEATAIVGVTRRQMDFMYDGVKSGITKLDRYILANRRKS